MVTKRLPHAALLVLPSVPLYQPMACADVDRADWLSAIPNALATLACKPTTYLRACFDATAEKCENMVTLAANICIKRYASDIPNRLGPAEGEHHGGVLGGCVGAIYEIEYRARRSNTELCNLPSNWLGTEPTWIGRAPIWQACPAG